MRPVTPGITEYVSTARAAGGGAPMSRRTHNDRGASRSINYSASPLLASKTPVWRSKFIVAALALAFAGLGRARGLCAGVRQRLFPAPG